MKIKILIFSLLVMNASTLFSQQKDSTWYLKLKEFTITATRVSIPFMQNPGAVSLVNFQVLNTMPRAIAVDEALKLTPGVRIDNQANGSRIHLSVRGQGILSERGLRGIKVIIDGIPMNDPTGFAADLYDIDWTQIDHIEVLRGPSASLYGGSSSAGILNIVTKNGGTKPFGAGIFASAGSNGFYKAAGNVNGSKGNLDYRVSFSQFQGNGYRLHTAFKGQNIGEKINWHPSAKLNFTQVLMITEYFNQNAEGLNIDQVAQDPKQANPDAIPMNEYQKTRRVTNGFSGNYLVNQSNEIQFNVFLKYTDYKEPGSKAVQYRNFMTPGYTLQYNFKKEIKNIHNTFSAGTDMQWQTIREYKTGNIKVDGRTEKVGDFDETVKEDTVLLANQVIKQANTGFFLLDKITIGEKLGFMVNLRYDAITNKLTDLRNINGNLSGSEDFNKLTCRIGTTYQLSQAVNLYANWGQGFLPPATEELASNPKSFGGFNQDLVPAESNGEEIGIRGSIGEKIYYDLTGFYMNTKNDFYRYRILPQRPLETFYGNAGSSKRMGFESFISAKPVKNLVLQLAYTYSNFKYSAPDSINGNWLPNSPQHQLYVDAAYTFAGHFCLGVSTELQSKWFIYTDEQHSNISQDGFNLYHARISYKWQMAGLQGEISLQGKNLLNTSYIAFTEPDPDGNSYQPGSGREFFGVLTIRY